MDWFSFCLTGITLLAHSALHLFFLLRLTEKAPKLWYFSLYLLLLSLLEISCIALNVHTVLAIAAQTVTLYGMSRFVMKNRSSISWTAALLAVYISQLSFGIINGLEILVISPSERGWRLYGLVLLATLLSFLLCAGCYLLILMFAPFHEAGLDASQRSCPAPDIRLLLFPCLFSFSTELYILQTAYQVLPVSRSPAQSGKQLLLISLQALGIGAVLSIIYAYQRICQSFQARAALSSLAQAAQAQKAYLEEAKSRNQKTRAFRHDIRNHLAVLRGLLEQDNVEKAKAYLKSLESASASLSLPWHTGNPVVDILLEEKLGFAQAKGIRTEVSLLLPESCQIDDFDLCVIFANALDNAIAACLSAKSSQRDPLIGASSPFLRISGERQGDFCLLEFQNTCLEGPLPPMGVGLSNIQAVAETYHGTIMAEKDGASYRLNVLLNISLQSERHSSQSH